MNRPIAPCLGVLPQAPPDVCDRWPCIRRRDRYFKDQEALERDEKDYRRRLARYLALERDLRGLLGIRFVSSALVWNDGYPLGGASGLSGGLSDLLEGEQIEIQRWAGVAASATGDDFAPLGGEITEILEVLGCWGRNGH